MLTLLIKDFKLMFAQEKSLAKRIITALFTLIFVGFFVGVETFLFTAVLGKIEKFPGADRSFMVLFLAVISILMAVGGVFQAKKLFFNEKDIQQLSIHPISNGMQIFSKLVFLFLIHYATSFLFTYPLFIAYGTLHAKTMMYYYVALFYPAATFLFEMGVSLIFVYPVWILLEYLRKHVVIEFTVSVVLLIGLTYLYSLVLEMFVSLVANNELNTLFTLESMAVMARLEQWAVPVNFLASIFLDFRKSAMGQYLGIAGGLFFLGVSITVYMFHRVRNISVDIKPAKPPKKFKPHGVTYGLIKKELSLITKNPDYIYSFSGLLIIQPMLTYLIITAVNAVFTSGTFLYYTTLFPNFVSIVDVFFVMMIAVIINSGANQYISMEERTIKNLKTIPVGYRKQIYIKLLIPFTLSEIFLLISLIVLYAFGVFTLLTAAFSLLLTTVFLFVFDFISLREELNIRHGKPRSTYMSSVFSYLLPIVYIAVSIYLSYTGLELSILYLVGTAIFAVIGVPVIVSVNRNMGKWFMELEAIN